MADQMLDDGASIRGLRTRFGFIYKGCFISCTVRTRQLGTVVFLGSRAAGGC
jgi:hypothetical protein